MCGSLNLPVGTKAQEDSSGLAQWLAGRDGPTMQTAMNFRVKGTPCLKLDPQTQEIQVEWQDNGLSEQWQHGGAQHDTVSLEQESARSWSPGRQDSGS